MRIKNFVHLKKLIFLTGFLKDYFFVKKIDEKPKLSKTPVVVGLRGLNLGMGRLIQPDPVFQ